METEQASSATAPCAEERRAVAAAPHKRQAVAAAFAPAEANYDAPATPTDKDGAASAAIEGGEGEETARRRLRRKGGWVEWRRGRAGVKRGAWLAR